MPRKAGIDAPGAVHHIIARGHGVVAARIYFLFNPNIVGPCKQRNTVFTI